MASKAIWTGVIGSLWSVAAAFDILPEGLTQAGVLTVVFRKTAKARIV